MCFFVWVAATLYASCILLGVFLNSSVPIFFELFVETVYPVPEGITCGVVTFLSNMFMGVLLFFLTFYHEGKESLSAELNGILHLGSYFWHHQEEKLQSDLSCTLIIVYKSLQCLSWNGPP